MSTTTKTTNSTTKNIKKEGENKTFNSYLDFIIFKESDLYSYGRYVVNKCLFNKESKTAQKFIYELIIHRFNDEKTNKFTEIADRIAEHETLYNKYASLRDEAYKNYHKLTISQSERDELITIYKNNKQLATAEQTRIDDLSKQLETISTDYSDLVQVALLQNVTNNNIRVE